MDYILGKADEFQEKGLNTEILTVDNHADAAYLYLKLKEKNPAQAEEVLKLLKLNGGNSSGAGIGCVDAQGVCSSGSVLAALFPWEMCWNVNSAKSGPTKPNPCWKR